MMMTNVDDDIASSTSVSSHEEEVIGLCCGSTNHDVTRPPLPHPPTVMFLGGKEEINILNKRRSNCVFCYFTNSDNRNIL
jgi:hypothetical protein